MRKLLIPVLVFAMLALSLALVAGCSSKSTTTTLTSPKSTPSTTPSISGAKVSIIDFSFNPSTLTVAPGTTVTWTNNGSTAHTITGPDWDSGQVQPGSTFTHTFNTAGTFAYHCTIHPTMTGQIIVTASGTSGGGTTTSTTPSPSY